MKEKGIYGINYITDRDGTVEYAWKCIDMKVVKLYPYRKAINGEWINVSGIYTPGTIRTYIKRGIIIWGDHYNVKEVKRWLTE